MLQKIKEKVPFFDADNKFVFGITALIMFITHGFSYFNVLYTHDSLNIGDSSGFGKIVFGRWLYFAFVKFRHAASPWLIGVLCIVFVSGSVVLMKEILHLTKWEGVCVGVVFSTCITLTALFCTYINDADADCCALLLACMAVYFFERLPKGWRIVLPTALLTLSMALYQSYVCVAIGLFLLIMIRRLTDICSWKDMILWFWNGINEIVVIFLSVLSYFGILKYSAIFFNVALAAEYEGAANGSFFDLRSIMKLIPEVYRSFFQFFFQKSLYTTDLILILNKLLFICLCVLVVIFICCIKNKYVIPVLTLCIVLLPLALNAILLGSEGRMHQLMILSFNLLYIVPFILIHMIRTVGIPDKLLHISEKLMNSVLYLVCIAVVIIGVKHIVFANEAYLHKKLVYDNTVLHAQKIWEDVWEVPEYTGEEDVVFMGNFKESRAAYVGAIGNIDANFVKELTGASVTALTYDGRASLFYKYLLGRNMKIQYNQQDILENEEYRNMPTYPKPGYCKMMGDRVIVKISE